MYFGIFKFSRFSSFSSPRNKWCWILRGEREEEGTPGGNTREENDIIIVYFSVYRCTTSIYINFLYSLSSLRSSFFLFFASLICSQCIYIFLYISSYKVCSRCSCLSLFSWSMSWRNDISSNQQVSTEIPRFILWMGYISVCFRCTQCHYS